VTVDLGSGDLGYVALVQRIGGGDEFAPLDNPVPKDDHLRAEDASIPTEQSWDASERINAKLEALRQTQGEHERRSARRHRSVKIDFAGIALLIIAAVAWFAYSANRFVADPCLLRAKLEQNIEESFQQKRAELLARKAPRAEMDDLRRWRDDAGKRLEEAVTFSSSKLRARNIRRSFAKPPKDCRRKAPTARSTISTARSPTNAAAKGPAPASWPKPPSSRPPSTSQSSNSTKPASR
jgi:hypothetical protein